MVPPNRLFAATYGGLCGDGGATWTVANGSGTGALKILDLSVYDITLNSSITNLPPQRVMVSMFRQMTAKRGRAVRVDTVDRSRTSFNGSTVLGGAFESGIYRSSVVVGLWR